MIAVGDVRAGRLFRPLRSESPTPGCRSPCLSHRSRPVPPPPRLTPWTVDRPDHRAARAVTADDRPCAPDASSPAFDEKDRRRIRWRPSIPRAGAALARLRGPFAAEATGRRGSPSPSLAPASGRISSNASAVALRWFAAAKQATRHPRVVRKGPRRCAGIRVETRGKRGNEERLERQVPILQQFRSVPAQTPQVMTRRS